MEASFADDPSAGLRPEDEGAHWLLGLSVIVEWDKGDPVGPLIRYRVPVASDGTWVRRADGTPELGAAFPADTPPGGSEEFVAAESGLKFFIMAPLLAISFMHARNAELRLTEPPERLARAWGKRHRARPLRRYYVLDVEPLRRRLDSEGQAQSRGLRHALHVCRGHFKTYTEDAPLLGRHVGTYWWPAVVRGRATEGRVEKDYRVGAPGVGKGYQEPDEEPAASARVGAGDPDVSGRGAAAHARTQNQLAQAVRAAGLRPRSPAAGEPRYDLAWDGYAGETWVAEVKSITPDNEERQLRLALGQVLRYRHALAATTGRPARPVIAAEAEPSDPTWRRLCSELGVALIDPAEFEDFARSTASAAHGDGAPTG